MGHKITAINSKGQKQAIPERWLDLNLGFKLPPSRRKGTKKRRKGNGQFAKSTPAEPKAEPTTKEEPDGSNAG
ncbi:hypothetical protein [Nesterenkonia populi]|uniref:hypothetical protein n=1 Tax=Nesterenkonia populi TaxID=1591087 RepID=UPI0011BE514A|nr:hypothetical protein [Nesterenkonia populi]